LNLKYLKIVLIDHLYRLHHLYLLNQKYLKQHLNQRLLKNLSYLSYLRYHLKHLRYLKCLLNQNYQKS
jgi:hypothetical protein